MEGSLPHLLDNAMEIKPEVYLGIDPTAARAPYTWVALDTECRLISLAGGNLEDLLAVACSFSKVIAAVNSATKLNHGVVRARQAVGQSASPLRGVDMRLAEYLLRERGIIVNPTPSRMETCASWVQMGFQVHRELEGKNFVPDLQEDNPRRKLETNAHAVFCSLLGKIPLPRPTLEGRLQRQLILHTRGADIGDPMEFFEEITRHKLLQGNLPMETIHQAEQLDALAAAFTAWSAVNKPENLCTIGNKEEGQILLPIKELEARYS
jgi:hypothetical protein